MHRLVSFPSVRLAAVVVSCAFIASCHSIVDALAKNDRPVPIEVEHVPVNRAAVVPSLLAQLDQDGFFRYVTPNVAAGDMPFDTALAQAREFLLYAQTSLLRGVAENGRGAFIDMNKLVPCRYPQLLPSVYEAPPPSFGRVIQIWLGDHWSIPFCGEQGEAEVIVEIAARRNETRYYNRTVFGPPADEAKAFSVVGIRWRWHAEYAVTPERAVNLVFDSTRVRVTQLPNVHHRDRYGDLIDGTQLIGPSCSLWRVSLEKAVGVTTRYSQRRLELSELYVADNGCPGPIGQTVLLTAWSEQPESQEFVDWVADSTAPNGFRREVHFARFRAPVQFESVILAR